MMLLKTASVMLAGTFLVAVGTLGYMISDRAPPLDVKERVLLTPKVRPSNKLEWKVRLEETKRCFIHTDRVMYDATGRRFLLPPLEFQAGLGVVGEEMEFVANIQIPLEAALGPARLQSITLYRCNLIQWLWPLYTENEFKFEVVPL